MTYVEERCERCNRVTEYGSGRTRFRCHNCQRRVCVKCCVRRQNNFVECLDCQSERERIQVLKQKPLKSFMKGAVPDVRVGRRFLHKRYIQEVPGKPMREWPPDEGTITKIASGMVYFKLSGELKAMHKDTIERFEEHNVKQWL